jgi:hypothetical protein
MPAGVMQGIVSAEALHEAAHVVIAVRSGMTVTTAGKSPWGFWYVNINFDGFSDPPSKMWAYKIAGSVAVEIRNIALGRSDNPGFGKSGDGLSDRAFCDQSAKSMRSSGMPATHVNAYRTEIRANVERTLRKNWAAVEALAGRLDEGMPLDGHAIRKILQAADRSATFARRARAAEPGLWSDMRSPFELQSGPFGRVGQGRDLGTSPIGRSRRRAPATAPGTRWPVPGRRSRLSAWRSGT